MKRSTLILLLAALTAACTRPENTDLPVGNDTVYTEKAILNIYGSDPQRALTMIDSSLLVGNIDEDRATLLRARVYCYSADEWPLDTVNQMLEGLLESDFSQENPNNRPAVLDLLVYASRRRGDNVAYLRWATEKADFCRQQGDETEALRTEAEIGAILTSMGEVEKGLSKLDGVIAALDKQRHFNEMDACIIALKRKIYVLCNIDRYDEAIPLANRMIEKLNDYRKHPEDYNDGSFRLLTTEEKRLDYCNFYTSQAYSYLMIAYADLKQSDIQAVKQSYADSARHYLALFTKSNYSNTLVGKMMLAAAYLRLGQYGKVKPLYDEIEARMGADTINSDYAVFLRGHAIMAEAEGNYYAANNYGKRYNNLKELLNKQLLESRAYEYSARYQLQEEQAKVEAEKQKAESNRRMAIVLFVFALAAIGFIVRLLFQRSAIKRKNKVLAEKLSEKMKNVPTAANTFDYRQNEVSQELRMKNKINEESNSRNEFAQADSSLFTLHSSLNDNELFEHIADVVRKEQLFTDPNFGRQTLVDRFGLSDRRVGAVFSKGSPYASVTEFTREMRLEYACQLLTERLDMNVGDIATASGFNSPEVFYRAFKAKHEITPTYYRSHVGEKRK